MVGDMNNNLFLINAPAGSGKTTTIEKKILDTLGDLPNSKILCITYTNRAAEELLTRVNNNNVQIQTIHSYINEFVKIYFSNQEILQLYFEVYGDRIKSDIINKDVDKSISRRNDRYKDKFKLKDEEFNFEVVKKNIISVSYNELAFNSLYYGGVSHDELLSFAKKIIDVFPILKKRIADKFDYIYIDEYQDTSADVLNIFYDSVQGTDTKLFLLGDKMQQIYKNYDGSFEGELNNFNTIEKLTINYRSSPRIVDVLNKIYNDEKFIQEPNKESIMENVLRNPKIIITNDLEDFIGKDNIISYDTLKLYVFNRARFKAIGAENLYSAVNGMDKYANFSKYSAVEVLTKKQNDNPDELMNYLFTISDVFEMFSENEYGRIIQTFKNNKIFNYSKLQVNIHNDKIIFRDKMVYLCKEYYEKNHTIKFFLEKLITEDILLQDKFIKIFEDEEYNNFLLAEICELKNLNRYLKNPHISTQHGVKGEGHNSVCFIAENSSNPSVKMYDFFELFCNQSINLMEFQKFYYEYAFKLKKLENELCYNLSSLNVVDFKIHETKLTNFLKEVQTDMETNIYFKFIFADLFDKYFSRQNKTNVVPCLKLNNIFGILTAYRIFYVGCSRAKEELTIVVELDKITGFKDKFETKMKNIGFDIILQ